jgi:uncharacterized membrane protein YidH (DUF202 family)
MTPAPGQNGQPGQHHPNADPSPDPGLARERTALAWTRTAISFAAVGGVVLKREAVPGLILLALAPVVYLLGRQAHRGPGRLRLITATIIAVALVALVVALVIPAPSLCRFDSAGAGGRDARRPWRIVVPG